MLLELEMSVGYMLDTAMLNFKLFYICIYIYWNFIYNQSGQVCYGMCKRLEDSIQGLLNMSLPDRVCRNDDASVD